MIHLELYKFDKPVAFYPYTSQVKDVILKVDTWSNHMKPANRDEEHIIEFIENLLDRCDRLDRGVMDDKMGYLKYTTRRDNKTAVAMTDGKNTLYFGFYDNNYYIGLDVYQEFDYKIDLSDLKVLPRLVED